MKVSDIKKQIVKELSAVNISSAEIDAQILLEKVTGKSREFLLANPEYEQKNRETKELNNLVEKRKKCEPIAYLIGHKEFYGLDFEVTKDVLIPRPETELLVEQALKFIKSKVRQVHQVKILDVGTGSGNIIISVAKSLQNIPDRFEPIDQNQSEFLASDFLKKALMVARKNAKKHRVKINFIQSDLFENINGKFDLIVANLPYVPAEKYSRFRPIGNNRLYKKEIDFEPQEAIFAADNGTVIIKKFLDQAKDHINKNGLIFIEVDPRNAIELKKYASKLYKSVELKEDFSGIYRMLKILT